MQQAAVFSQNYMLRASCVALRHVYLCCKWQSSRAQFDIRDVSDVFTSEEGDEGAFGSFPSTSSSHNHLLFIRDSASTEAAFISLTLIILHSRLYDLLPSPSPRRPLNWPDAHMSLICINVFAKALQDAQSIHKAQTTAASLQQQGSEILPVHLRGAKNIFWHSSYVFFSCE